MTTVKDDANVYLIPASSAEDNLLIDRCLKPPGLDESKVKEFKLDDKTIEQNIDEINDQLEENLEITERDDYLTTKEQLREIYIELNEEKMSTKPDLLSDIKTWENSLNEFEQLQDIISDSGKESITCWPIDRTNQEQYKFNKGDLLLFYTGDNFYEYIGIIDSTSQFESLGKLIVGDPERGRPFFLALSEVHRVQVDSSVIADLTGRDIDSVQKISPLSGQARDELLQRYGSLSEFVTEARTGINTLLSISDEDSSDEGNLAEPKSQTNNSSIADFSETQTAQVDTAPSTTDDSDEATQTIDSVETEVEKKTKKSGPEWQELAQQLHESKQVVLVGAQGTGKRRLINDLLTNWIEERGRIPKQNRIIRTQFTASTDYSEFVLGKFSEQSNDVQLVRGPFGQFIDIAAAEASQFIAQDHNTPPKYVMVIEGFQNADPAEVFGEFYQALRPDNRGPENMVSVPGANASLWIPEEVYIIAVADTPEMSTQQFGTTIGSPFAVRHSIPDYEILYDLYEYSSSGVIKAAQNGEIKAESILALEKINQFLKTTDQTKSDHLIGHMYLSSEINELVPYDTDEIISAWQYDIFSTLAGVYDEKLSVLQDEFLTDMKIDYNQITLATLQTDPTLTKEVIRAIAKSHPDY